jgi:hypothetical protein
MAVTILPDPDAQLGACCLCAMKSGQTQKLPIQAISYHEYEVSAVMYGRQP